MPTTGRYRFCTKIVFEGFSTATAANRIPRHVVGLSGGAEGGDEMYLLVNIPSASAGRLGRPALLGTRPPVVEPATLLPARRDGGTFEAMEARLSRITIDPQVCGGQPCVRGLRIPVSLILKHLAAGRTAEQIIDEFPEIEVDDIRETLRYASWLASGRTIEVPSAA